MSEKNKGLDLFDKLIEINTERISGYEKAASATEPIDADIRSAFMRMAMQSKQFIKEIKQQVPSIGKLAHDTGTLAIALGTAVVDITADFTTQNRKMLLDFCLYLEQGAQKAYDVILEALDEKNNMVPEVARLVKNQRVKIGKSFDSLQSYVSHK